MTLLAVLDIAVRIILYGSGVLALFVLVVAAFAPRAANLDDDDLHGLDLLDKPGPDGLTEWDLDTGEDDPADECRAYPHECELSEECTGPDPWARTLTVCLTHQRTTS